jgi:16S rRNA (uracil1498-N3)-methyltransferase
VARIFVPRGDIEGERARITGAELDHLRVLRLRPRDGVVLFDDTGLEHEGFIESCNATAAEVRIVRSYHSDRESPLEVILGQCLGKGEKMDWVVEKAVELGVRTIVPLFSTYTIPRLDESKMSMRQSRWGKIALSAAKQSGRTRIPEIIRAMKLQDFIHQEWPGTLKLMFWEAESSQGILRVKEEVAEVRSVLLVVGPEGGFAEPEVKETVQSGFRTVHLGRRILRTETAALAALVVVQLLWGDMA